MCSSAVPLSLLVLCNRVQYNRLFPEVGSQLSEFEVDTVALSSFVFNNDSAAS